MDIVQVEAFKTRLHYLSWIISGLALVVTGLIGVRFYNPTQIDETIWRVIVGALLSIAVGTLILWRLIAKRIERYQYCVDRIDAILTFKSSIEIDAGLAELRKHVDRDPVIGALVERSKPALRHNLVVVLDTEKRAEREAQVRKLAMEAQKAALARLESRRQQSPVIRAERMIAQALEKIRNHRALAERQLDEKREKSFFKWWGKLSRPDFAEVDAKIAELEDAQKRLLKSGDIDKVDSAFAASLERIVQRVADIRASALSAIPGSRKDSFDAERTLHGGLLFGALSVPVSAWGDLHSAGNIYDSLREVNGHYAGMSDFDIWLETLTLPGEQLAGLAALTKGAYFESLVEADFGGARFEHFNHPDTDITIDGIDYQIKATDSASYIATVDSDIPVISTSEVAAITGSIDGGYTNADLTDAIDLALGGTIFDISDAFLDAVLSGLGGVSVFSAIKGVNAAWDRYQAGGDAVESLLEGVQVVAINTARSAVNIAELVWRIGETIVTSAPVRFTGRLTGQLAGSAVDKFDRWVESEGNAKANGAARLP